jgi:hypothetical protein
MLEKFITWLEINKPKSSRHYTSGYNTINNILKVNGFPLLESWNSENYENNYENIISIEDFKNLNSTGNNILTATLSNYKIFLDFNMENIKPPIVPFEKFGWRWATTGISSKLNLPVSLFAVLDAILINGNGELNKTNEFKKIIKKLCTNKYEIDDQDLIKTLTREDNEDVGKNIIENSGNYWRHIGLVDPSGQNAKVTELGKYFLKGIVSKDEFVKELIANYSLPSPVYDINERQLFVNNNLTIYPFKIILEIFEAFYKKESNPDLIYLTELDLKKIVVPFSLEYKESETNKLVNLILQFREDPTKFEHWPNCYSHFGDDKGDRMINEYLFFLEAFDFLTSSTGIESVRKVDKKYYATDKLKKLFKEETIDSTFKIESKKQSTSNATDFSIESFAENCKMAGLIFTNQLIQRFIASLCTKPFVICSGLSGSGKTKLAQAFTQWITSDESQYVIAPVGADWTNREPLLGYPNALNKEDYINPENGVLDLMIRAKQNIENEEEPTKPYFLILDEMNLSHVERYFADFLSTMESGDSIPLHKISLNEGKAPNYVPQSIKLPKNLFIIGTVNIDETTYMFSPKVLDRANTIEFRLTEDDLDKFIQSEIPLKMDLLEAEGTNMSNSFMAMALQETDKNLNPTAADLKLFFTELKKSGAEFGYRTASEIGRLMYMLKELGESGDNLLDIAIMQKLLPKLHGSRNKLTKVLPILGSFCLTDSSKIKEDYLDKFLSNSLTEVELKTDSNIKYKISFEKICRMYKNAVENGFASYAEA